jgi:predicted dienelactone hydrolase
MDTVADRERSDQGLTRIITVLIRVGLFAVVAVPLVLWLEHLIPLTLPKPTGPFAVGRVITDWSDSGTADSLAPEPGTHRQLIVWIWYPAVETSGGTSEYLPARLAAADEHARGVLMGKVLTRDLTRVRTHAISNAAVSPQQPSYPVLIMRGGASSPVWNYSVLAEDLASHGYVVVGFDAPYRTGLVVLPDGRVVARLPENNPEACLGQPEQEPCIMRVINAWTGDMSFALDRLADLNLHDPAGRLTGRLDLSRVGAFGHSLGGAEALQFCHLDARCKAGANLDGALHGDVVDAGLDRPFMILLSDHSRESGPQKATTLRDIQSVYDRLPANGRALLQIRGANHYMFSDDGALVKSHIVLRILRAVGLVGTDGRRQLAITTYCLRSFFDAFLKNGNPSQLTILSPAYPELQPFP